MINLGHEIAGGIDAEAILLSLEGSILRKEACGFSVDPKITSILIYQQILEFRRTLLESLINHLKNQPVPPLGELIRKLRELK